MRTPIVTALPIALLVSAASAGPDLICAQITDAVTYGAVGAYQSYGFGDATCNIGDAPFTYSPLTGEHPVRASSLYKLKDGRLTQIGLGFVAHTFFPLQGDICGLGCVPAATGMLGPGCSNVTGAALSGAQGDLAPRIEIDPWLGVTPYPFTTINQTGDAVYKRVKARIADLSDPDALYFVETQYISNEETGEAARGNNASYRRVFFTPASNSPRLMGDTYAQRPAIYAWRDHGLGPGVPDPDVTVAARQVPGDGLLHVASKATDLGDGSWRYDYAVHNQNVSAGPTSIEFSGGAGLANFVFNDVEYLDAPDSMISGADWIPLFSDSVFKFQAPAASAQLANAVRWGTTYAFSFTSTTAPGSGVVTLGLHAQDDPGAVRVPAVIPGGGCSPADINADGSLDFFDVSAFLNAFNAQDPAADFNGDGQYNFFDVSAFLNAFADGCP